MTKLKTLLAFLLLISSSSVFAGVKQICYTDLDNICIRYSAYTAGEATGRIYWLGIRERDFARLGDPEAADKLRKNGVLLAINNDYVFDSWAKSVVSTSYRSFAQDVAAVSGLDTGVEIGECVATAVSCGGAIAATVESFGVAYWIAKGACAIASLQCIQAYVKYEEWYEAQKREEEKEKEGESSSNGDGQGGGGTGVPSNESPGPLPPIEVPRQGEVSASETTPSGNGSQPVVFPGAPDGGSPCPKGKVCDRKPPKNEK